MRTDLLVAARALILMAIAQLLRYVEADQTDTQDNKQHNYNYYNNHNYETGGKDQSYYYNSYDTGPERQPEPDYQLPKTIACFSCTLVKHDGHIQGMKNCDDPFVRLDIPSVDCKGPCGKLYHQHGEKDFVITRGCIPNCKEHRDDKSYTQCCTKAYCNKSSSLHVHHHILWLITVFLTVYFTRR